MTAILFRAKNYYHGITREIGIGATNSPECKCETYVVAIRIL